MYLGRIVINALTMVAPAVTLIPYPRPLIPTRTGVGSYSVEKVSGKTTVLSSQSVSFKAS